MLQSMELQSQTRLSDWTALGKAVPHFALGKEKNVLITSFIL